VKERKKQESVEVAKPQKGHRTFNKELDSASARQPEKKGVRLQKRTARGCEEKKEPKKVIRGSSLLRRRKVGLRGMELLF